MDLFKELGLLPVRSEPAVWVKRVVILEQILPKPIIIRDIPLEQGLNIIWAEDMENDNPVGEITGHSAGKTTFCRLLRYLLGERTFGPRSAVDLIRRAFPEGHVAGELVVYGRRWAVRRPFGPGRMTYIKRDSGLEELLAEKGRPVSQETYAKEIGLESVLDNLETGGIVQTGEPIQWGHILAWCTRDQEARFQNIHDWRSIRSESESPSFRFPKAGPLFVMRAVLGLFLSDELKGEEKVADLQRKKDKLAKQIEDKRREPDFRVNLYDRRLRHLLGIILPEELDLDSRPLESSDLTDDITRLTKKARNTVEVKLESIEQQKSGLQDRIDVLGAELKQNEGMLHEITAILSMDAAALEEVQSNIVKREGEIKKIEEWKDNSCPLGDVPFRDCIHIQQRRRVAGFADHQDLRLMEEEKSKRVEARKTIEEQQQEYMERIEALENKRKAISGQREKMSTEAEHIRYSLRDLDTTSRELVKWIERRDRPAGEYEELNLLQKQFDSVETEMIKIETELRELIKQHDTNKEVLTRIFSRVVVAVLSSGQYDGEVNLDNRELSFRISNGPLMTGEAVETLAVLLADVSCLLYSSVNEAAHMPGFLVHDSPREADLGLSLYRSFIRLVAELDIQLSSQGFSPFQYVITTTTPPPPELNNDRFVRLRLNAAKTEGLLFKKNIAVRSVKDSRPDVLI